MKYEVIKDYQDIQTIPATATEPAKEKVLLELKAGQVFIPAETHYPAGKVQALVGNGTLRLIEKPKPAAAPIVAAEATEE